MSCTTCGRHVLHSPCLVLAPAVPSQWYSGVEPESRTQVAQHEATMLALGSMKVTRQVPNFPKSDQGGRAQLFILYSESRIKA